MVFIVILCKIERHMSVYFISLSEVTEEHNCECPELPDQFPDIILSLFHWRLSSYEGTLTGVALYVMDAHN